MKSLNFREVVLIIIICLTQSTWGNIGSNSEQQRLVIDDYIGQHSGLQAVACNSYVDACVADPDCSRVFYGVCDHNQTINTISPILKTQDMNVPPRVELPLQGYVDNEAVSTWECWNLTATYFLTLPLVLGVSGGQKFLAMNLCFIDSPALGMVLPWQEFPIISKVFFLSSSNSSFISCRTATPTNYNTQATCMLTAYQTPATGDLFRLYIRGYSINLLQQLN